MTTKPRLPEWLDTNEYPFESQYYALPMGHLHYVDEGAGPPVVMLHGNPSWSFGFRKVITALRATHRCIAPDLIGFGLSAKRADWDYRPESHAANIEQLLNTLNLTGITLIVNDWGGPIGLSYALKYPERIKKLIILNTWLWNVNDEPHYKKFSGFMGGPIGRFLIKHFNFFGKVIVKKAMGNPNAFSKAVHAHYYLHLATPAERKGCWVFPKEIIASGEWLRHLWEQRHRISSLPTTIIWGMKDIAFREKELQHWVNHWHRPQVVRLADVGHFPAEEAPAEIIRAVDHD